MPTNTKAASQPVEAELSEEKEKPRSILKNPTYYPNSVSPTDAKFKKRGGRLLKGRSNTDMGQRWPQR